MSLFLLVYIQKINDVNKWNIFGIFKSASRPKYDNSKILAKNVKKTQ